MMPLLQRLQAPSYTLAVMLLAGCRKGAAVVSWGLLVAGSIGLALFVAIPSAEAQRKKVVFGAEEEGEVVEGYVHKPEVGYIITRQDQEDLETLQLKESFAPKIINALQKAPF